jgi:amino acid permease
MMAANLDQLPADGSQRVVIRPQRSTVIAFNVVMGTISLIGAGAMLVQGSPVAALVCLGIYGLLVYAMLRPGR